MLQNLTEQLFIAFRAKTAAPTWPRKQRLAGPLGTGDQRDHWGRGTDATKKQQKLTRTHQETPELTQEAPQMLHDLTDPLFKPFRQLSLTT